MALEDLFKGQRSDPFAGKQFGRAFLQRCMASGDRGNVYYANMVNSNREVAVRILNPMPGPQELADVVLLKVNALRHTVHPNIVQVLDAGLEGDRIWIASEFVAGEPLSAFVRKAGKLDFDRATTLARDIARGLEVIHATGTSHGDLRPSGVLMDRHGNPRINGAGLPRLSPEDSTEVAETVAPELLQGGRVDARSDMYSLGCIYYFMLSGKMPSRETALDPDPAIPPRARPVLEKMLAPNPESRYATAREAAGAIDRAWFSKDAEAPVKGSTAVRRKPKAAPLPGSVWTPPPESKRAYIWYAFVVVLAAAAIGLRSAPAVVRIVLLSAAGIPMIGMGWQLFKQDARLRGILALLLFAGAPAIAYGGALHAETLGGMVSRLNLGILGLSVGLTVGLACLCNQERSWFLRLMIVAGVGLVFVSAYDSEALLTWMKASPGTAGSIVGGTLLAVVFALALLTRAELGGVARTVGFVFMLAAIAGAYLLGCVGEWREPVADFVSRASAQGTVAILAAPTALVGHLILRSFK